MEVTNVFNGMLGKVQAGLCRLSMSGSVAIKTNNGYKTYNLKTNRLTNCSSFVFNIGEDFFFVIPTNHVVKGDIILASGKPKCVIDVKKESITVINYEDAVVENILPERHAFMGNSYFYGKIVSMFGNSFGKGKKGMNKMLSYMMMSEMMKGNNTALNGGGNMNAMLPFMLMGGGGMSDMFEGMFDFELDDSTEEEADEPTADEEESEVK